MSERKAYRVRQSVYLGDDHFTAKNDGHPYLALPWPEDCPWEPESFPLPGEWVEVTNRGVTGRIMVLGPPRYSMAGKRWMVPAETKRGELGYQTCKHIPAIWNARKDAKDERVVGTIRVIEGGGATIDRPLREFTPGKYDIIRREEP